MDRPSLNASLQAHCKLYWGVATDIDRLSNCKALEIACQHFGQITPENSMKWAAIHPLPDEYTFSKADNLVSVALDNQKLIRGHCLLWHLSLPMWVERVTDPNELKCVIEAHIATVMSRYRCRIYAWDVVNEPFLDDGTLRPNHFFNILGEQYIAIAFNAARRADPDAKLYLNDYMTARAKIAGAVQYVKCWKEAGVPIDGIGVQGHISKGESDRMSWTLRDLATVVDEVAITELDIVDAEPKEYVEVVRACLAERNCVGITSWGMRDCDSWRAKEGIKCLLFDHEWQMKEACKAVLQELKC